MPIITVAFTFLRPFLVKAAILVPIAIINTVVSHQVRKALIKMDKKKAAAQAAANVTPA